MIYSTHWKNIGEISLGHSTRGLFSNQIHSPWLGEIYSSWLRHRGCRTWGLFSNQIHSPWLGEIYSSWLRHRGCRTCSQAYVACRAGTTTLCQSWLYPPSQGLCILQTNKEGEVFRSHIYPLASHQRINSKLSSPCSVCVSASDGRDSEKKNR